MKNLSLGEKLFTSSFCKTFLFTQLLRKTGKTWKKLFILFYQSKRQQLVANKIASKSSRFHIMIERLLNWRRIYLRDTSSLLSKIFLTMYCQGNTIEKIYSCESNIH